MRQASIGGLEDVVGRHKDDFYVTPPWVTHAIVPRLKTPHTVLDVGCGTGAIGRTLRQVWQNVKIVGIEADVARAEACNDAGYAFVAYDNWLDRIDGDEYWYGSQFRNDAVRAIGGADLIISNPPFRHALRFLELALDRVKPGGEVAFLLPAQWDQETNEDAEGRKRERGRLLDRLKHDGREGYGKYAVEGRIDFKGDGRTDRIAYAWFVFGPGHEGVYRRVPTYAPEDVKQLKLGGV